MEQAAEAAPLFALGGVSFWALTIVFGFVSFLLMVWADEYFYKSELVAIAVFVGILHWIGGVTLLAPWTWSFWVMLVVGALFFVASFREEDFFLAALTLVVIVSFSHEVGGAALFGFLTWTFWILIGSEALFLFWCVDHDEYIATPVSILITAAFLQWVGDIPVLTYIYHNPLDAIVWYLVPGVMYVCGRWFLKTYKEGKKTAELADRFFQYVVDYVETSRNEEAPRGLEDLHRRLGIDSPAVISAYKASAASNHLHPQLRSVWKDTLRRHRLPTSEPRASDHKEEMFVWFIAWPWSLLWFFIEELIEHLLEILTDIARAVWDFIFDIITDALGRITKWNYRHVDESMLDDD